VSQIYCAAPWRGLHINPSGDVKTCCAGKFSLGNLNTGSIKEILQTEKIQHIRNTLSQGKPHEYCANCIRAEKFGADGERAWHNRVNPDFDSDSAGSDYHWPTIVDVRWSTTCNLSCNYCSPSWSSKWAALQNLSFVSGTRPYYQQVCEFIGKHHEHVHEVALVGGEPLLLPENEKLLDVIPDSAIVTLITNLSVDLNRNKIFKKLAQRNLVGWSMSFDNTDQRFEYVRHGADWNMLIKNIGMFKELTRTQGHWGGIHAVYNIYNATRICELKKFAEEHNLTIVWQTLVGPAYLDPFLHGSRLAELATKEIQQLYESGLANDSDHVFFDQVLKNYQQATSSSNDMVEQFAKHTKKIETVYHTDQQGKVAKLWPELAELGCDLNLSAG